MTYGRQAGARAADRAAFRQAATYFEQALEALGHLPATPDTQGLAIELRLGLAGRALFHLGEYEKSLALLREAEALAQAHDNQAQLVQVLARLAIVLRHRADLAGALAAGQQALALATALGDVALQMGASYFLGQAYYAIGDYGRAADLFRRNVEGRDPGTGRPDRPYLIGSQAWLAYVLSQLGQFTEGRCHGEEALRLATGEGRGAEPMLAHGCLGRLYLAQGDLEAAIRLLDQGLALCRATDNWNMGRPIAAALGYACALAGRLVEGRALLEEALRAGFRMGALHNQSRYVAQLSAVCLLAGRVDEAFQHARQALALARQYGERGYEAHCALPAGRRPCPGRPAGGGPERGAVPGGAHPGRGTRYAPAPGALSPWPRHPACQERPAGAGPRRTGDGYRSLPCHGDDLLAAPGRGGAGAGGGTVMDFYDVLDKVQVLLKQRGRVSYRALKVQFQLDEEALEALKEELIAVHHLAIDQDGTMLVWVGEVSTAPASPSMPPTPQAMPQAAQSAHSCCPT